MDDVTFGYISLAIRDMLEANYQIELTHNPSIYAGSLDDTKKIFVVNTREKVEEWFPTFIHEYCHFLQLKERKFCSPVWDSIFEDLDTLVDKQEKMPKKDRIRIARNVRRVETDCEKRAVKEIKKHKLPVDLKNYIRNANAYIFSHNFLVENRIDVYRSGLIYEEEVKNTMPTHFLSRYDRMPKKYRQTILRLMEKEK